MPYCPNCRYEYKIGVRICPDCDEELVDFLPEENELEKLETYHDWIQVARFTSPQIAEMLIEVLRANDIPSTLISGAGHFGQTGQMGFSSFVSAGSGYSLMIPREFVEQADKEATQVLGEEWEKAKLIDIRDI
ncbi:MAG: hypothetical protein GY855_03890 [candidate division Zixibacteria bacterium]|nr:hypothetical protein [candidate division Zixibacteria bacterium]